jgi:hypothetical protein
LYLPDVEKLKNSRFESKKDNEILFWFSKNDIVNKKLHDVKFLHGHTHAESYDENNLTYAIGRKEHKNELKFKELKLDK